MGTRCSARVPGALGRAAGARAVGAEPPCRADDEPVATEAAPGEVPPPTSAAPDLAEPALPDDESPSAAALADEPPPLGCLPRKPTTSALVRRPSLPEPEMEPGSRLFSSTSRRTDGLSLP